MLATQYLISLGHRRIAVITGPTNSQSSQARLSGYMAALQKNGISADPHLIKVGDYVSDKAYKAACDLLEMREQDRPTAIFAFNDLGAINVYRAARQHGISLPTVIDHRFRRCLSCGKHVSVFDDHQAAIRPHRQTMHRSDSRSTGGKGGTELLHSSHAARRTRKLRISSTAVVRQEHFTHSPFSAFIPFIPVDDMDQAKNIRDNGKSAITGTTLSTKHPLHMQYASVTSIYFCLPDEDTKEAMKLTRFHIRGMPTMKPQQKNGSARSMNQQTKRRAA